MKDEDMELPESPEEKAWYETAHEEMLKKLNPDGTDGEEYLAKMGRKMEFEKSVKEFKQNMSEITPHLSEIIDDVEDRKSRRAAQNVKMFMDELLRLEFSEDAILAVVKNCVRVRL